MFRESKSGRTKTRAALLVFQIFFMIFALVIVGLGGAARSKGLPFIVKSISNTASGDIAVGIIILGLALFVLAAVGFVAIKTENRGLMTIYLILFVLVSILCFAVGIAMVASSNKIANLEPSDSLYKEITDNYRALVAKDPAAVCRLQQDLQCAGFDANTNPNGCRDMATNANAALYCPANCQYNVPTEPLTCLAAIQGVVTDSFVPAGGITLFIALIMFGASVASFFLCGRRKNPNAI